MPDSGTTTLRPSPGFLLLLLCYFALHVLLRVQLSSTLDFDEAEQAVLAQWLLPGYTEQPPLYTWVQHLFFQLFGHGALAVSLLKNTLLFFTYLFVYLSGLRILKNRQTAMMATISLLMIPQIGWESQRDMTHTVLVVFAAAMTLYQLLRTAADRSTSSYFLLGLCFTTGFLGKSNFTLFLAATLLSLLLTRKGRKMIIHPLFLLSLGITVLACSSYLWWMYGNQEIVFASTYKFKQALDVFWLIGPLSLIKATIFFLFPCWLFWLFLFPAGFKAAGTNNTDFERQFIRRYIPLCLLLVLLVVLIFKVTYVKDRWLQPLLFATPLWFFSRLEADRISQKKIYHYGLCGLFAAVVIYSAFTLRIVAASNLDNFSRMNYPFQQMAADIRSQGFSQGLIVTDKRFLAGNILLQFPESTAIIPGYRFEELPLKKSYDTLLVIWMPTENRAVPEKLAAFLEQEYKIASSALITKEITHPYLYTSDDTQNVSLGIAIAPLPKKAERTGSADLQGQSI